MNSLWVNIDHWGHNMWPTTHGMPDWPHGIPLGELCTPSAPRLLCHGMSQLCPKYRVGFPGNHANHANHTNHQLSLLPVTHLSQSCAWLAATFAQKIVWVSHSEGDVENGRHASFRQLAYGSTEFKTFDLGNYRVWSFTVPRPCPTTTPLRWQTKNEQLHSSSQKEWTWRSVFSWNITRLARGLWVSGDLIAVHYRNLRYFPALYMFLYMYVHVLIFRKVRNDTAETTISNSTWLWVVGPKSTASSLKPIVAPLCFQSLVFSGFLMIFAS